MDFVPNTKEELVEMEIQNDKMYNIQYINTDYFNGEESLEVTRAKALVADGDISFLATDPYGMDMFISQVKILV